MLEQCRQLTLRPAHQKDRSRDHRVDEDATLRPVYTANGPFRPPRPSAEMRTRMPIASQLASMKLPP